MVPGNAIKRHPVIEQRMRDVAEMAETFPFNRIEAGGSPVTIRWASSPPGWPTSMPKRSFPMPPILHLGMTWPLPEQLIRQFAASVERLIVIEELDPFIEEAVRLMGHAGRRQEHLPDLGELDPHVVRESAIQAGLLPESEHVADRGDRSRPVARSPAGALPGLPASRRLLCAEQAQSAGQWRYRLLHPGLDRPVERHPHLRLHGRRHRRGAWRRQGRQQRAPCGRDRRFDLLPHRHAGLAERRLQQQPGDHDHHG